MRKIIPLLAMTCMLQTNLWAQVPSTSFETDFSPGAPTGTWYDWVNPPQMVVTFENDEMHVVINRTMGSNWDRLAFWVNPFNIEPGPYFSMRIASDLAIPLGITFKDTTGATLNYSVNLTGGNTWDEVFINMTGDLPDLESPILAELQFDPDPGTALQATLLIDDVKLGNAARPSLKPPTIQQVGDMLLPLDAGPQTVSLQGISNGGDPGQSISVSAASDNPELIPSLSVTYASPDATGILSFTPAAGQKGEATITVTVRDDGILENETMISFRVLVMEYGGDGFTDDFEAPEPDSMWNMPNPDYGLSQSGGILLVSASKNSGWESFSRDLPGYYDITSGPYLNLDVKGSKPFYLHAYLVDAEGNTAMRQLRILQTDKFVTASFDFSDADELKLDRITGMIYAFNGTALTFEGDIWFDNLKLGTAASNMAYMAAVPDRSVYLNSGSQELFITDITNAGGIAVASQGVVVENLALSDITNGIATLTFHLITDATGSDTVTLTAEGLPGYSDYTETFVVSVEENLAPVMDQVEDLRAALGIKVETLLEGIDDGNPNSEQALTISAASSDPVVIPGDIAIEYHGGPYATLVYTPASTGLAEITVTLTDDGGGEDDTATISFGVEVFASINHPPTIAPVDKQSVFNDQGEVTLELTGISDGDDGSQGLSISAWSSADSIIPNPLLVVYGSGETAQLKFTPEAGHTGTSTITVKIVDDGGTAENNGNDSVTIAFEVDTRIAPLTGWVVDLGEGELHDYLKPESEGVIFFTSVVDSGDFNALKIVMVNKWEFGGMWMDLPVELELTDNPYISYDIYPVGSTLTKTVDGVTTPISDTYHWNYFYDVDGQRNILNSGDHMFPVPPDQWTTLSFDYSDPGDMQTSEGADILSNRINAVLFNLHWRQGAWPFTDMSGTVFYRNIRIGDQAIIPERTPVATLDEVAGQARYVNSGEYAVTLTGISDGAGSVDGVSLSAFSGRSSVVPDPVLGPVMPDGTATLTYMVGGKTGTSPITVTVSAAGSDPSSISFDVDVVSDEVSKMATVLVDRGETWQTIEGMGTFENERRWTDLYARDMGASAVRIGLIGNQIEPVNDNNDPFILDMKALNYGAIDFGYFRMLKEAGVETFILTSWSPPAWMKKNLSEDWLEPNAEWNTNIALNRLEFHYYDEFAESMVAVVRMFEQEADIHIEAIGLQNEPAFDEPYASAILDPFYFTLLIEVVGKRFEAEGITTRLYMPEQVVGQYNNSNAQYLDALQHNVEANPYCDIYAVHGYGEDGITPGVPSYAEWVVMYDQAQLGEYPKKVWMTETHIGYSGWNSAISTAGAIHGGLWAGNISLWTNWSFGDMQMTRNIPNSTFYACKNYFRYIRPGALRIGTHSNHPDVLATAFEHHEDGTFTVVLINKGNNPVSVDLSGNNLPNHFSSFRTTEFENCLEVNPLEGEMFILPGSSITTLYATDNPSLTINDISSLFLKQDDPKQNVPMSGISDGEGATAGLSLSAESSDPMLTGGLTVTAVQPDGTAELSFTPGPGLSGSALVTVTLTNGTVSREVKFYVVVQSSVGLRETSQQQLKVYPNPATDQLMIELPYTGMDELVVTDIIGRTVLSKDIGSGQLISLNVNSLESGMYHLVVRNGKDYLYARFVVK
ncbi:MAG: T9SS type A sorting domain-containing protein [Bacteroidales bacterium]